MECLKYVNYHAKSQGFRDKVRHIPCLPTAPAGREKGQDMPTYKSVEMQPGNSQGEGEVSSHINLEPPCAVLVSRQIDPIISRPYPIPSSSFLLYIFSFSRWTLSSFIFLCLLSSCPPHYLSLDCTSLIPAFGFYFLVILFEEWMSVCLMLR